MRIATSCLYMALIGSSVLINKYILSVLKFKYPTIFQGWHSLAAFLLYKILATFASKNFPIIPMDRSGFISLVPGFLFFVGGLVSMSKALSTIPLPVFISGYNMIPALVCLVDQVLPKGRPPVAPLQAGASLVVLITAAVLIFGQVSLTFSESGYFWLLVGSICTVAHSLHTRIADARYGAWDKLYYACLFSVVFLAPASLYLEEAFQALKFRHDRQELFLAGCLVSAALSSSAQLWATRLRQDEYFGPVSHLGLAVTVCLSVLVLPDKLAWWQWLLVSMNIVCALPLPSHLQKEDEEISSSSSNGIV